MSLMNKITKIFLPILLVVIGVVIGGVIIKTTSKPQKKQHQRTAYAVNVVSLQAKDQHVQLHVTGTVSPALDMTLKARVAGEIIEVSPEFIEGGSFQKNEVILKIDRTDYELALEQKKAALAEAEYQLKLEEGQSDIAAREWELLKKDSDESEPDRELALRKPQLTYRKAQLDAAKAEIKKARLDLERTKVRAPFNAVVTKRQANLGNQVTVQDTLATLAGADRFYVRASVPVNQLNWITCDPDNGSSAVITRNTGDIREGRAVRLESAIEEMGRMARVIIGIDNPLEGEHPLLLNEYVRVAIQGAAIDNAYKIPRSALHDDLYVWIVAENDTLEIREVTVGWRNTDDVIVTEGLRDGDRLVLTKLSTPINGMKLRIAGNEPSNKGPVSDEK